MNLIQTFKLHLFAYRIFYILYFFIILCLSITTVYFYSNKDTIYYLSVCILLSGLIFTFVLGIYEYNRLSYHYLNLKTFRIGFYFSCLIHTLINAIVQTGFIYLMFTIIHEFTDYLGKTNLDSDFPYFKFSTFLIAFLFHILISLIGSSSALFFRGIRNIKGILYFIILIIFSMFFKKIADFIFIKTQWLFKNNHLLYGLIPIIILASIFLALAIFFKARKLDMKK